ncbi:MAG: hypothetical protein ACRD3I_04390, partial [Terriglobales bacterium]
MLIFLISKRLHYSRPTAWLCVLYGISITALASWTTQARGDLIAVGFSLLSVYLVLPPTRWMRLLGAAVAAGIAVLVKQTFLAAPIAIVGWHLWGRRYSHAAGCAMAFGLTVISGYGVMYWLEPMMLEHMAAIRDPVLEFRGALRILGKAASQPVAPFAA